MAYFIFLKYFDSLEEFRKNLCVQIPPKSPCANFPKPWYIQKSNFIRKRIFLQFLAQSAQWPAGPSGLSGPKQPGRPSRPTRPCPPLPLAPSLTEPAASPPPLAQPCHGRRTAPSFFRTMELQQLPPNNSPLFN
jgi:hypothetical protein